MHHRWLVAALLVATSVPGVATAAPCGRAAAERARTWFASEPPLPDQGPVREAYGFRDSVRAVAIDPGDGRVVFMTDSAHVHRSADGGCTWSLVWSLGPEDTPSEIGSIDVARVNGKARVLLTVLTANPVFLGRAARTRIVRSDDGVTGWRTVYDTLGVVDPQTAWDVPIVVSGAGGVAYATVPGPQGLLRYVRSTDATTWEVRTPETDLDAPVLIQGVFVSPWNPDELWEWGGSGRVTPLSPPTGLRRSTDGGRTWQPVQPWAMLDGRPPAVVVDVAWPRRGGPARVVAIGSSSTPRDPEPDPELKISWSNDGGATFSLAVPPVRTTLGDGGIAHTPRGDLIVVAPRGAAYRVPHTGRVPRREEWRPLPRLPHTFTTEGSHLTNLAVATATAPTVVLVPTYTRLQLLTVSP